MIRWTRDKLETGISAVVQSAYGRGGRLTNTITDEVYIVVFKTPQETWKFQIINSSGRNKRSKDSWPTYELAEEQADRFFKRNRAAIIAKEL